MVPLCPAMLPHSAGRGVQTLTRLTVSQLSTCPWPRVHARCPPCRGTLGSQAASQGASRCPSFPPAGCLCLGPPLCPSPATSHSSCRLSRNVTPAGRPCPPQTHPFSFLPRQALANFAEGQRANVSVCPSDSSRLVLGPRPPRQCWNHDRVQWNYLQKQAGGQLSPGSHRIHSHSAKLGLHHFVQ